MSIEGGFEKVNASNMFTFYQTVTILETEPFRKLIDSLLFLNFSMFLSKRLARFHVIQHSE